MRTKNSFINLIVSWCTQLVNVLLQFVLRTVFIHVLSTEYLGLNGLFSNILSFLSFAELGFGAAVTFSLYRPLAGNDEITIAGIMNFFKKIYYIVGLFVLTIGLLLTPFIEYFIRGVPDIPHIHMIYALWVINSGASYFLVYKSTLIIADQRKDIVEKNNIAFKVIQLAAQIGFLLFTHNYILYLLVQILVTLLSNLSISVIADYRYKFLRKRKKEQIANDVLKEIKRNVSATIMHKVGAIIIFGTDNILLSGFFGLTVVGLYSNYYLVIKTLSDFVGQIQTSVAASVGNLGVVTSVEKKSEVFEKYLFMIFWIFCFTSTCLMALLNPFIKLWIGDKYTIPVSVVAVLVFNYFLNGIRSVAALFDNAFGLFWDTRKLPVVESILNIVISIVLAKVFGYIGVFLGTAISSLISGTWFEPYVLYKVAFKKSPTLYYKRMTEYIFIAVLSGGIFTILADIIVLKGVSGFIIKCLVTGIGSNLLLLSLYARSDRMKGIYEISEKVLGIIKRAT